MNVAFWSNFKKRKNSTKRPTGGGTVYDCTLKEGTSIRNPEISLKWDGSSSPVTYTYASIGAFGGRVYYVGDWVFENRQWTAKLEEDVLGTFQTAIGLLEKYVIRSGGSPTAFNAGTPDAFFPAGFDHDDDAVELTLPSWTTQPATGGSYVVGIVGNDNSSLLQVGGASYGVVTATELNKLITAAYTSSNSLWTGYSPTSVEEALGVVFQNMVKSITNPSEFFAGAMWFPFSVPASSGTIYPSIGPLAQSYAHVAPLAYTTETFSFYIPVSSLFGDGKEPNFYVEPYTTYYLEFWPFGVFPINGRTLVSSSTTGIQVDVRVDLITGTARFEAYRATAGAANANAYKNAYLCGGAAKLGVDLPIGGAKSNYAGGLGQLISTVGAAAAASSGWGVAAALGSGALNVAQSIAPTASSGGACAGFAGISNKIRVHRTRFEPAGLDYTELGKAYAEKVVLATIPGFIQCWDGDCEIYGTISEREEISSYLTGGFFYE